MVRLSEKLQVAQEADTARSLLSATLASTIAAQCSTKQANGTFHRNKCKQPHLVANLCDALKQLVELKNGSTFNGHLVACDNFMNLTLREVYETSAVSCLHRPLAHTTR